MKPFLLLLLIVAGFLKADAQGSSNKERFAFVSIYFDDVYKIKIDSGQAAITKKGPFLTDSTGNILKFVSVGAALNHIGGIGWKFQSVLHDIDETYSTSGRMFIQTTYYYLFKKEY